MSVGLRRREQAHKDSADSRFARAVKQITPGRSSGLGIRGTGLPNPERGSGQELVPKKNSHHGGATAAVFHRTSLFTPPNSDREPSTNPQ